MELKTLEDFYRFLDVLRLRPAMYLGRTSIDIFYGYFNGLLEGARLFEKRDVIDELSAFNKWVAMKLGYFEATSGWANMLLEFEKGDHEKALEKFFIFLDEFKVRKVRVLYEAELPEPTKKTASAQIISYTADKGVFLRWIGPDGEINPDEFYCQDLENAFFWSECLVAKLTRSDWKKIGE